MHATQIFWTKKVCPLHDCSGQAVAQGLIIIIFNHRFLSSGESYSQNSLLPRRTSTYVGKRLIKIRRQIIPTSPFPLLVILPVPGNSSLPLSNHLAWPPDPMFPLGILSCVLYQYLSNVLSLFLYSCTRVLFVHLLMSRYCLWDTPHKIDSPCFSPLWIKYLWPLNCQLSSYVIS